MEKLEIPFSTVPGIPSPEDVISYLKELQPIAIDKNPWPQYSHSVKASYSIAHNGNAIFLKYHVVEDHMLAGSSTNGDIHKDSCVEFFIAFEDDNSYYNLEFNSLGWGKIGYGADRENRTLLSASLINRVATSCRINSSAKKNGDKLFTWEMVLVIPLAIFCHHNFSSFKVLRARGNFYKCGDNMPEPHFLTWSLIKSPTPDFHQKEYFAEIEFS